MKTSEVIGAAHDYIEEHGWCQNSLVNVRGQVCLQGAIFFSSCHVGDYENGLDAVSQTLLQNGLNHGNQGIIFNDSPTTTKQDVLNLLQKTQIGLEEIGE